MNNVIEIQPAFAAVVSSTHASMEPTGDNYFIDGYSVVFYKYLNHVFVHV